MIISRITPYMHTIRSLLFHGLLVACAINILYIPMMTAGMPQMSAQELAEFEKFMQDLDKPEMQQFIKEFESEFNKLPPEVQEELNKQAMEDLKRMGIDPYSYQPAGTPAPTPTTPAIHHSIQPPAPQPFTEPASDCSQVTTHSSQQASALLQNTISYLEIVRQKLGLVPLETNTVREWLGTIAYYIKMMNKPEHVKRLTSVTFTHLYDLITELEALLRAEAGSLIILAGEEESRSDDPYAILGIPYHADDEDITKAYEKKCAEYNPATIKKELEQLQTDLPTIKKRVRQATLRQATLADAYEQLQDHKLRQQLDRCRSNTHEQQLSLRAANGTSIERLYTTLNTLIQQGLIKELEDFFARYAPTELTYHQQMEESEKERFAEQRPPPMMPMPSSFGGGFPYGGYQPQPYYPPNSYFPQSYQPNFTPQPIIPGSHNTSAAKGSTSAAGAQPATNNSAKSEKSTASTTKKETPKAAEEPKKTTKKKRKKSVDGTEQIAKEFTKNLNNLKEPMNNFKDYIQSEEQAGVRTIDILAAPPTRAGKSITDECFRPLHEGLKRHINPELINKFEIVRKFIIEKLIPNQIPNQKAIDACRSVWEKHHKEHDETYKIFAIICKHVLDAVEKNRLLAQQIPWNNVLTACQTIEGMKELFKKPNAKNNTPAQGKPGSLPALPLRPSVTERDQKIKEKEKQEKARPTWEEAQAMVQALKTGCELVEKNIQQGSTKDTLGRLIAGFNAALANNNLEEMLRIKTSFDALLATVGFNELSQVQSAVKKLQKALPPVHKEAAAKLIKDAKICKKLYPALYEVQAFNKAIKEVLRSMPPKNSNA